MEQAIRNRKEIEQIKLSLGAGVLSYDEAKEQAQPIIDRINKRGREIAKKYGKKHYPITFIELMR